MHPESPNPSDTNAMRNARRMKGHARCVRRGCMLQRRSCVGGRPIWRCDWGMEWVQSCEMRRTCEMGCLRRSPSLKPQSRWPIMRPCKCWNWHRRGIERWRLRLGICLGGWVVRLSELYGLSFFLAYDSFFRLSCGGFSFLSCAGGSFFSILSDGSFDRPVTISFCPCWLPDWWFYLARRGSFIHIAPAPLPTISGETVIRGDKATSVTGWWTCDTECNHTLLKMRILAFLPISPCSTT